MRWLSTAARTCAPKRVRSTRNTSAPRISEADGDEKEPVGGEALRADLHRTLEVVRHAHRLLLGGVEPGEGRDRDEDDADGQQALVEVARPVQLSIERSLQHDGNRRAGEESDRQRGEERPAELVGQADGGVAADHGEAAVRQVDEIHHPQRHRQPHRQQEQQHPVGEPVEEHARGGREHQSGSRRREAFDGSRFRERRLALSGFSDYFFAAPCFLRSPAGSFTIGMVSNGTLTSSLPTFCTRRM